MGRSSPAASKATKSKSATKTSRLCCLPKRPSDWPEWYSSTSKALGNPDGVSNGSVIAEHSSIISNLKRRPVTGIQYLYWHATPALQKRSGFPPRLTIRRGDVLSRERHWETELWM